MQTVAVAALFWHSMAAAVQIEVKATASMKMVPICPRTMGKAASEKKPSRGIPIHRLEIRYARHIRKMAAMETIRKEK